VHVRRRAHGAEGVSVTAVVLIGSREAWAGHVVRLGARVVAATADLDAEVREPAHLVGSGDGAVAAQEFAAAHPERVRSLVLDAARPSPGLGRVVAPVLLTAGAHDPEAEAFDVAAELQDAHVVVFPFAGRTVPQQEPAVFARLAAGFHRTVDAAAPAGLALAA
jgi:pimeloyl-ACP methyl ester carboxylesterase